MCTDQRRIAYRRPGCSKRSPVAHRAVSSQHRPRMPASRPRLTARNSGAREFGSKLSQRVVGTSLRVQPGPMKATSGGVPGGGCSVSSRRFRTCTDSHAAEHRHGDRRGTQPPGRNIARAQPASRSGANTTDLSPAGRMPDAARPDGARRGRRPRLRVSGSRGVPKRRFGGWSGRRPVVAGLLRPGRVWSSAG